MKSIFVEKNFYISPDYSGKIVRTDAIIRQYPDRGDMLLEFLIENTLDKFFYYRAGAGRESVLCEILGKRLNCNSVGDLGDRESCDFSYNNLILIRHMPNYLELPEDLTAEFDNNKYRLIENDPDPKIKFYLLSDLISHW